MNWTLWGKGSHVLSSSSKGFRTRKDRFTPGKPFVCLVSSRVVTALDLESGRRLALCFSSILVSQAGGSASPSRSHNLLPEDNS